MVALAGAQPLSKPVHLKGPFGDGGTARIKYRYGRREGTRNLTVSWRFSPIDVRCKGDDVWWTSSLQAAGQSSSPASRGRRFGAVLYSGDPDHHPKLKLRLRGRLRSPSLATGRLRLRGSEVPLTGGAHGDCDSGRLHFRAHRQRHVTQ